MADITKAPRKLWEPSNPKDSNMYRFMQKVNQKRGLDLKTFQELWKWSTTERLDFWGDVWDYLPIIYEGQYTRIVDPDARMDTLPRWFEGIRLNFAENVLYTRSPSDPSMVTTKGKEDNKVAVTEVREGCKEIRDFTWKEVREKSGLLANAMRAHGVKKGDRVALVASNSFDTLCVFMAVTSLGGLFSSSSTDMGTKGVLDRLLQISPKFIFMDDWAVYNGKTLDLRPKMRDIVEGMEGDKEFLKMISMPRFAKPADVHEVPKSMKMAEFEEAAKGKTELKFERVDFRDPFIVVYSSGTTGQPKCIVHSTGGVVLSSVKEAWLHRGVGPETVILQYTTTGWIMYLASIYGLECGARSVLYDGSPFQPDIPTFMKLVGDQKVTNLGISPRYMHTFQQAGINPKDITDLSSLENVTSTGMVLSDALFEWFYDTGFPSHVQLENITGGTDLGGCFGIGNPLDPVYVGGCQGGSLGIAVAVFDQSIESGPGREVEDGVPGELVANKGFPNQPVFFWGDKTGEKYHNAYYARFEGVWTHGDFIMKHPITGQIFVLGRSDGVLNPSGVRFGSAEIYNVIEEYFIRDVMDSICVGQRRQKDSDESVVLFLMMQPGKKFTPELVESIKRKIGQELSKRHVPKYVFETPQGFIPTTINLKKVELPVKQIISGMRIKPSGTLANPQVLDYYYQFAEDEVLEKGMGAVKSKL